MKRNVESLEINLIPYIDILLVLVLILMLGSSMSYSVHDINLPSSTIDTKISSDDNHIIINSSEIVSMKIGDNEKVLGQLKDLNPENFASIDKTLIYTIDADLSLSYQKIIDLLSILRSCGLEKVSLAMQSS